MGFNYGLEKKNFDSRWAVTRKQYEDAGMSNEAIQAMYDYPLLAGIRREHQDLYPYSHPYRTAYGRRSLHWRHCSFWLQACPERPLEQKEPSCLRFGNQRGRSGNRAPDLSEVCL